MKGKWAIILVVGSFVSFRDNIYGNKISQPSSTFCATFTHLPYFYLWCLCLHNVKCVLLSYMLFPFCVWPIQEWNEYSWITAFGINVIDVLIHRWELINKEFPMSNYFRLCVILKKCIIIYIIIVINWSTKI